MAGRRLSDHEFLNVTDQTPVNGEVLTIPNSATTLKLTIYTDGDPTIEFRGSVYGTGDLVPLEGVDLGDFNNIGSTTSPTADALWEFSLTGLSRFTVNLTNITTGDIQVLGLVVD